MSEDRRDKLFFIELSKFLYQKEQTDKTRIQLTCNNLSEESFRLLVEKLLTPFFGNYIVHNTNPNVCLEYSIPILPFTTIICENHNSRYNIKAIMDYFHEISEEHVLATLMGQQLRLGSESVIHSLSPEILRDNIFPSIAHIRQIDYSTEKDVIIGNLIVMRYEKIKIESLFPMDAHVDNNQEYILKFSLMNQILFGKFIGFLKQKFRTNEIILGGQELTTISFVRDQELRVFIIAFDKVNFKFGIKGNFIRQDDGSVFDNFKHHSSSFYFISLFSKYLKSVGFVDNGPQR